jgi:hypothetical protein
MPLPSLAATGDYSVILPYESVPTAMQTLRLNFLMVITTIALFCATLVVNELLFTRLEFTSGVNWIYLPAGMRLLCTLLFAEAGALGLLLVSWGVCFLYFFPNDFVRSFMGGIIAAAAPYLVYRVVRPAFNLQASLANLTPAKLLVCAVAFSLASPLLHHIWFAIEGKTEHLLQSFLIMATGDLTGTLIVLYSAKGLLALATAASSKVRH